MKKYLFLILSVWLLLFLTACNPSDPPVETEAAETADLSKADHAILPDYLSFEPSGTHDVRILFANVGKADAILLEIDGGKYMIDTGTTDSVPALLTAMAYMNFDSLDGLIVTHAHNDHVGGADEICRDFSVDAYFVPAISQNMRKLTAPALSHEILLRLLEPGEVLPLSDGVGLEVLGPYRYNPVDDNNNSLVMKLRVNGTSILFASDMLYDEEKTLLNGNFDLSADLLKVGHHGRKDATSVKFFEAVSPKIGIISTDSAVEPDSPHPSVLYMMDEIGAAVHVTEDYDTGILVTIEADGSYTVENARIQQNTHAPLTFSAVSADEQTVDIRNNGTEAVDMSGYFLFSKEGSEIFVFPKGTILAPGKTVSVAGKGSAIPADFVWDESKPWSKTKKDTAILYDKYGNILDEKTVE